MGEPDLNDYLTQVTIGVKTEKIILSLHLIIYLIEIYIQWIQYTLIEYICFLI